jgi:hypothetical protein
MVARTSASQKVCAFSDEQPQGSKTPIRCTTRLNPWDLLQVLRLAHHHAAQLKLALLRHRSLKSDPRIKPQAEHDRC